MVRKHISSETNDNGTFYLCNRIRPSFGGTRGLEVRCCRLSVKTISLKNYSLTHGRDLMSDSVV
jgi:hypothetical protein